MSILIDQEYRELVIYYGELKEYSVTYLQTYPSFCYLLCFFFSVISHSGKTRIPKESKNIWTLEIR